jgi:lipopolysaccharide/colanic/teichoic acid biosynthesis glycosyltransferase
MIRIRGFARKTRRLTKGGSLSAAEGEVSPRNGQSTGDDQAGLIMGTNGHGNGNGNGVDTRLNMKISDRIGSAREERSNGTNGHRANGSNGNGSNGSNGHANRTNGNGNGNGHGNGGNGHGLTDYLHSVVESLVEPHPPIEGRPPLDGKIFHGGIDGQAVPKLETLFARAALAADSFKTMPRWKRIFDATCILLTLPIWLPMLLLVMGWIKLVSPGPIFYRQERVGYRGRRFMIFKFRTMHVNAETRTHEEYFAHLMNTDSPMTKLDALDDHRLVQCGRWLRASGLDELPQLFNVLRGEMSLVGPRPCLPNEFERYSPAQKERVNAPPGLTGYWQVNGKNKTTFSEMIAMDIHYCENMSVALDLWVICRTIPALIAEMIESRGRRNGNDIAATPASAQR